MTRHTATSTGELFISIPRHDQISCGHQLAKFPFDTQARGRGGGAAHCISRGAGRAAHCPSYTIASHRAKEDFDHVPKMSLVKHRLLP